MPADLHELLSIAKIFRNKTNVPADLQSAGIEYQDLWSEINTNYL